MTTIAYTGGILAADTGSIAGHGTRRGLVKKIGRNHKTGDLYGACGYAEQCNWFVNFFTGSLHSPSLLTDGYAPGIPATTDELKREFSGVVISRETGFVYKVEASLAPYRWVQDHYALGSGCDIALGAMCAGASAERAAQIAVEYDSGSFGPVVFLTLNATVEEAAVQAAAIDAVVYRVRETR